MDSKTLTNTLAKRTGRSKDDIISLLEALAGVMGERCGSLGTVAVPGFGSFEGRRRQERVAVNPTTGKRELVPPKVQLTFKPSALLKSKLKDL